MSIPAGGITPQLLETGVMAIMRASSARYALPVAETLAESGIRCVEVTLTVPGALEAVETLSSRLPSDVAVGAGTVTTAGAAADAVNAGASFLVSPAVSQDVVEYATSRGVGSYPGAWTPSEVLAAWRSGASAVKLFPAASGGPGHLRRIREPFPEIPIVPTGGVGVEDVGDWLSAGAVAVGLGGALFGDALSGGDLEELRKRARRALEQAAAGKVES